MKPQEQIKTPSLCYPSPYLNLFLRPLVEVDGFDPGYVNSQVPVDPGTADADEHPDIPGCPSWPWEETGKCFPRSQPLFWPGATGKLH